MSESRDPVQEPKENESAENAESNGDVTEVNVSADETIIDDALPVDETEAALNQAQQELDEWRARAYRSAADLENARRRHQQPWWHRHSPTVRIRPDLPLDRWNCCCRVPHIGRG